MDKKLLIKATEINDDLEELNKYKDLLASNKYGNTVHFEIKQHYGSCEHNYEKVTISRKYNEILFPIIEELISKLELDLKNL